MMYCAGARTPKTVTTQKNVALSLFGASELQDCSGKINKVETLHAARGFAGRSAPHGLFAPEDKINFSDEAAAPNL